MINCPIENAYCDAADEGAALGLLGLMTGISEEYWCASWMDGLEFALWNAQDGALYGMGSLTPRQCMLLRLLSEECGGWWCWRDGPKFVSAADWLKMLPTDGAPEDAGKVRHK
jgi:hypothetical protein